MKAIVGIFRKPWFLGLLGILAIAALIWYIGPLLAFGPADNVYRPLEPERIRWLLIIVVVLLWLGRMLWKSFIALKASGQLFGGQVAKAKPPEPTGAERAALDERSELQRRMEEAAQVLKKARVKGQFGMQYIYQLPWYIIIGAPGSGKTTVLLNSGIQFPLSDRLGSGAVRGVGGTRNCDWWFTDEAVLLDTAGRYTTQDSDQQVDQAAWKSFLALLRKYRKRRPINGAMVTVSVSDLLQQSASQRQAHATQLRKRIQELHHEFGIRFPIYVLVTKCDLIGGFTEYFNHFAREDRDQVWGMTFPLKDTQELPEVLPTFGANFQALERRLQERVVDRLQQERDPHRRALLYAFPQQFAGLRDILERFLNEVFQATKFEERVLLRGVYFTSGTQEGTPIDRLISSLAGNFGVERAPLASAPASGKSFFVLRLLREVIFVEAGLAGTNLRWERRRQWLQGAAYAGAAALTLLLALAWFTSYGRNKSYVAEVQAKALEVQQQLPAVNVGESRLTSLLPLLETVRALPGGYAEREHGTPWFMGMGLYQGDKLGSEASAAYLRTLQQVFLPKIARRLEEQLAQGLSGDPEFAFQRLYEALKVYLMLDDRQHFHAPTVAGWLDLDWELQPQEISAEQRKQLVAHANALLEDGPPASGVALDKEVITRARQTLMQVPLDERVYAQLKRLPDVVALAEFRVSDASGEHGPLVFARKSRGAITKGVPGLFTYRGYHDVFKQKIEGAALEVLKESWVLGADVSAQQERVAQLSDAIRRRYFEDYIKNWEQLLSDLSIAPLADINRAALSLNILAGPDSPLRKLLVAIADQTTLKREEETVTDKAAQLVESAKDKLKKELGISAVPTPAIPQPAAAAGEEAVNRRFEPLHNVVRRQGGDGQVPLDKTLALLSELSAYVNMVAAALRSGQPAPPPSGQNAQALANVRMDAQRHPVPLNVMLNDIANGAGGKVVGGTKAQLNSSWQTSVVDYYRQGLAGRYPLNRSSNQDATRDDFGRFFGTGGVVDNFFQTNLKDFVDTSKDPWRARSFESNALPLSSATLAALQSASRIRDVFFRTGGQNPSLSFELKPISMDAGLSNFILDIDGKLLTYSHGPAISTPFQWPGPNATGQVRIQYAPPSASGRTGMSEDGPWALFRMFDKAQMESTAQRDRFIVTFDLEGRRVSFELRANSVFNPFRLSALQQFYCPPNL